MKNECYELIENITNRTILGDNEWNMDIDRWDWNPGVGLFGIACAYKRTKNRKYLDYLEAWFSKNISLSEENRTINSTAPFMTATELYIETGNEKYKEICKRAAEWALNEASLTSYGGLEHTVTEGDNFGNQMWADTLFMACIFLSKMYAVTGDTRYKEFVVGQLVIHHRYLRNKETGLYYHGYNGNDHMSSAYWARANAWIILGTYIIMQEIGDFEEKDEILSYVATHATALKGQLNDVGGFNTVLARTDSRNYFESSATAGFAAALRLWHSYGLLDDSFVDITKKAEKCVLESVDNDGLVCNVSCGTPIMESIEAYYRIPVASTLYGQGLTLMMLCL